MQINTIPASATVQVSLEPTATDPKRAVTWTSNAEQGNGWTTPVFRFITGDTVRVVVRAQDFEAQTTVVSFDQILAAKPTQKAPYVVAATLQRLRQKIDVDLVSIEGATFSIERLAAAGSSAALLFKRDTSTNEWQPVRVAAEKPMYKTVEKAYTLAEVAALPIKNGRRQLSMPLQEIERPVKLNITANETDGKIMLDGKPVGKVPGEVTIRFTRPDGDSSWSTHLLRVEKEGYEYRPPSARPGQPAPPAFETNLTLEAAEAMDHNLSLPDFQPMNFFKVPFRRFVVSGSEVMLDTTNSISAKEPKDIVVLSEFGRNTRGLDFVVGRMGAATSPFAPGKAGDIVIALPVRESRQGQQAEIVGSSIWILTAGGARRRVTDAEPGVYDIDPCITKDGKTIYFSSNRRGQWGIWKKAATSGGARTPIDPGQGIDVEPTVFSTPDGAPRVAFTRYFPKAAVGTPPRVVVQSEDGLSFAETEAGRCPSWSNDGTRIAYVSPDKKIWWMQASGENPQQVTTGSSVDDSPVWLPGDKQIAYASAAGAEEARQGTGNFDIWRIDDRGNNAQALVTNPSFDGVPAVTSEAVTEGGKTAVNTYIYFLSNRGAQGVDQEPWLIWYFQLDH